MRKISRHSCMATSQEFLSEFPCIATLRRDSFILIVLVAVLSTLSVFYADASLGAYFDHDNLRDFRKVAREITDLAEGSYYLGFVVIMYFAARFAFPYLPAFIDRKDFLFRLRRLARFSLGTLLLSGLTIHIFKFLFGRQRPHMSDRFDPYVFVPFNFDWHFHSFPSGHSQVIFSVASLAALTWPSFRIYFVLLAAAIASTRVILAQHFLSDVLVGATIGYLVPQWIFALYWYKRVKEHYPERL